MLIFDSLMAKPVQAHGPSRPQRKRPPTMLLSFQVRTSSFPAHGDMLEKMENRVNNIE